MNAEKRARDLALVLREIIAEEGTLDHQCGEGLSSETIEKANRILNEGSEVSEYDQELQNYLDVYKGMKTRKEIEAEIARVQGFQAMATMGEMTHNGTHIKALKWCLSSAKKPR